MSVASSACNVARRELLPAKNLLPSYSRQICTRARPGNWLSSLLKWTREGSSETAVPSRVGYESDGCQPILSQTMRLIAERNWTALDPHFLFLEESVPDQGALRSHLLGTFGMMHLWRQGFPHCRAALFHTAYLSPGSIPFDEYGFGGRGGDTNDRDALRALIGHEAEEAVALLSSEALSWESIGTSLVCGSFPDSALMLCGRRQMISKSAFAQSAMIVVADIAECAHDVIQAVDRVPKSGLTMKPATEMYWMSLLCNHIQGHLSSTPRIFNECSSVLKKNAETKARDSYWFAVEETAISGSPGKNISAVNALEEAVALNPFVAEPHILLAQLFAQAGLWAEVQKHSARALELQYQWGTSWDKRAPFRQWVAAAQMLHRQAGSNMQASRHEVGPIPTFLSLPEYNLYAEPCMII